MTQRFDPQLNHMIRRLADRLDGAIDPKRDSSETVCEALMRLALASHIHSAGAEATRDRLIAMAMTIPLATTMH